MTRSLSTTSELRELGVLCDLDHELAETLARTVGGDVVPEVRLGAAFASWAVQNGHVCAELHRLSTRPWQDEQGVELDVRLPSAPRWVEALASSPLVAGVTEAQVAPRPLVIDGAGRLYLHRYFTYERALVEGLRARAVAVDSDALAAAKLREGLDRLLPADGPGAALQRLAATLAVLHRFSVVSGGPGTGKTFTVAKILLLLQEQALATGGEALKVELLAPTGKAAQRLGEAIVANLDVLDDESLAGTIPKTASTIHRKLGYQPRTPTRFRHGAQNPLPADVVVVDEASMVDVALMAKLVAAVRSDARLILLGDRDQLASVEAGAILGDVYASGERDESGYSSAFARRVAEITGDVVAVSETRSEPGLHDCMVQLTYSHRFPDGGGIAALARAINDGDAARALSVLTDPAERQVELRLVDGGGEVDVDAVLGPVVFEKYGRLGSGSAAEKLAILGDFRILCPHRRGPRGVAAVNAFVEAHLRSHGRLASEDRWYEGRPVMVTANDYQVQLFNGDVGVLATAPLDEASSDAAGEPGLVASFPSSDPGVLRSVALGRLPPHETVFAMSVHKAQGSEFDEIALLLPPRASPILTRELVYTAVTRAKRKVTVYGSAEVLAAAIEQTVQRASGLREELWR